MAFIFWSGWGVGVSEYSFDTVLFLAMGFFLLGVGGGLYGLTLAFYTGPKRERMAVGFFKL